MFLEGEKRIVRLGEVGFLRRCIRVVGRGRVSGMGFCVF